MRSIILMYSKSIYHNAWKSEGVMHKLMVCGPMVNFWQLASHLSFSIVLLIKMFLCASIYSTDYFSQLF